VAGVRCGLASATVFYDAFRTKEAAHRYYDRTVRQYGASRSSGSCRSDRTAEGTWTLSNTVEGRLLCTTSHARRLVIWVDDRFFIVGWMQHSNSSPSPAYRLWQGARVFLTAEY
jgi:hypothetical protein